MIELAAAEGVPDLVLHAHRRPRHPAEIGGRVRRGGPALGFATAGRIGTIGGRYWGMDRDSRWDRTKRAYDAIVHVLALPRADDTVSAVRQAYERDETDHHRAHRDRRLRRHRRRRAGRQLQARRGPLRR